MQPVKAAIAHSQAQMLQTLFEAVHIKHALSVTEELALIKATSVLDASCLAVVRGKCDLVVGRDSAFRAERTRLDAAKVTGS